MQYHDLNDRDRFIWSNGSKGVSINYGPNSKGFSIGVNGHLEHLLKSRKKDRCSADRSFLMLSQKIEQKINNEIESLILSFDIQIKPVLVYKSKKISQFFKTEDTTLYVMFELKNKQRKSRYIKFNLYSTDNNSFKITDKLKIQKYKNIFNVDSRFLLPRGLSDKYTVQIDKDIASVVKNINNHLGSGYSMSRFYIGWEVASSHAVDVSISNLSLESIVYPLSIASNR